MKFINLALLLIQIFLETKIIPEISNEYLNPKTFVFMGTTIGAFFITMELIEFNKFLTFCVLTLDGILGAYLVNQYYPDKPQFNIPLVLLMYYTAFIPLYFIKKEHFDQMFESEKISAIFKFISSLSFSNMFVNYFNAYHKETAANFEFSQKFLTNYSEKFCVDFIIIFGSATICDLIKLVYSKEENVSRIRIIIERIVFKIIICAIFFLILNSNLAEICYNLLFNNLSKPYNILVYNCFGYDPLIRMKVYYSITSRIFF